MVLTLTFSTSLVAFAVPSFTISQGGLTYVSKYVRPYAEE